MNYCVSNPDTVARYILSKIPSTQKKLHKLLYYCFGWYLSFNNDESQINNLLFENSFQAWVHGPVLREIYPNYSMYGYSLIEILDFDESINDEAKAIVDQVLSVYGGLDANLLEELTHSNQAWINARNGLSSSEPSKEFLKIEDIYNSFNL